MSLNRAARRVLLALPALLGTASLAACVVPGEVKIAWDSPPENSTISEKTTLRFTGQILVRVTVYHGSTAVAQGVPSSDGTSSTAVLDPATLPEGPVTLTAHAWNSTADDADKFTSEADAGTRRFMIVHGSGPAPTPTPAATPRPTPTPVATSRPTPTASPRPSITPTPTPTPAPTATPGPAPSPAGGPAGRTRVTPEQFGANGSDAVDDTAALQRALDAVGPGQYLDISAGKTYRHDAVLRVSRDGAWVRGPGTILATNEEQAAIFADGDDLTFDGGLTIGLTNWTRRHDNWETFGLRSLDTSGLTVRGVNFSNAQLYLNDAANFTIANVSVTHSQADSIHMTGGSRNGTVTDVTATDGGDDGVAVVSYQQDGAPCKNITITRARVIGTRGGRGISVIGGTDITYVDSYVERSDAAGIIVAAEPSFKTWAPRGVRILGATVVQAVRGTVGHPAVLVNSEETDAELSGQPLDDVVMRDITIRDTNPSKASNVRVDTARGATLHRIVLDRFTITGGPSTALYTNQGPSVLTTSNWTRNGVPISP
ncbi:MAG: right-handed parallel beta-helix repeat-containing protein [Solirubrobacteraceae bacterium]|nr:right-handed parallel beta-helix repeat-containing protein [Solirubrobacteraceae bacterium]